MSLSEITSRLDTAAQQADRNPAEIKLLAISKVQPEVRVRVVLDQGHRVFGENRVQEAQSRWMPLKENYEGIELHLVGPLQSNKVKPALDLFDAIHSLDRMKLARKLASEVQSRGACPELFIQVNTGAEEQKSGVLPQDADEFIQTCREMDLPISGLMVIPPADEEAALHFALLAKIAARNGVGNLSMGMSADFEKAVAFGATHVRVGSAIFGARDSALV